jgi:hypothetical protein
VYFLLTGIDVSLSELKQATLVPLRSEAAGIDSFEESGRISGGLVAS